MDKVAFDSGDLDFLVKVASPKLMPGTTPRTLGSILSEGNYSVLNLLFPIAGMTVLIYFLVGGYQIMLSGGNPKNIEQGKSKITHAVIGFLIIFVAYWLVQAIVGMLGLRTITSEVLAP